jgi:hypothetical protein
MFSKLLSGVSQSLTPRKNITTDKSPNLETAYKQRDSVSAEKSELQPKQPSYIEESKIEVKDPVSSTITPSINNYYGTDPVSLLDFFCTVWSRLAYMNNTEFVSHYKTIFKNDTNIDNVLIQDAMTRINSDTQDSTSSEFIKFAEKINIINGEQKDGDKLNCGYKVPKSGTQDNIPLIFTSIATSNYSQCNVFADQRMSNIIVVSFRGPYSSLSTASFIQPKNIIPSTIETNSNVKVIGGVYKILNEMIHTIIKAIQDIKSRSADGSKKIIITGHSLGGALATLFTYVCAKNKTFEGDKLSCVSIGAPRVFNNEGAKEFCEMCSTEMFEYKRIVNQNDVIPMLPKIGYEHPCYSSNDVGIKEKIFRNCFVQTQDKLPNARCFTNGRITITPNYNLKLNCTKKNKTTYGLSGSPITPYPLYYHAMYLGILFAGVLNLSSFMPMPFMKSSYEINRIKPTSLLPPSNESAPKGTFGTVTNRLNKEANVVYNSIVYNTACKLCFYENDVFKTVFFNLVHFCKLNGAFYEDIYVTDNAFKKIKEFASPYLFADSIEIPSILEPASIYPEKGNGPLNGINDVDSFLLNGGLPQQPIVDEISTDMKEGGKKRIKTKKVKKRQTHKKRRSYN